MPIYGSLTNTNPEDLGDNPYFLPEEYFKENGEKNIDCFTYVIPPNSKSKMNKNIKFVVGDKLVDINFDEMDEELQNKIKAEIEKTSKTMLAEGQKSSPRPDPKGKKGEMVLPASPSVLTDNDSEEVEKAYAGQGGIGNIIPKNGEGWGKRSKTIDFKSRERCYFSNENDKRKTAFSSHAIPISDSTWNGFHKNIKGEFKDMNFDFSLFHTKKKEYLKPIFGLEKDIDVQKK
jgi:hypothetical protein